MFFSSPSLRDIRRRLDNLIDDFDHSDLLWVIRDIESIMNDSGCSKEKADHLGALVRELYRCESGTELSSVRYDRYLDRASRC